MGLHGLRIYLGGDLETAGPAEFEAAAKQLVALGAEVHGPHEFGLADPDAAPDATSLGTALDADAAALQNADLVVLLAGGDPAAEAMAATFELPVASLLPTRPAGAPAGAAGSIPVQRVTADARQALPSGASSPAAASR